MLEVSKKLFRKMSQLLIFSFCILVLTSSAMAATYSSSMTTTLLDLSEFTFSPPEKAESYDPATQHVTTPESNEWTKDITIPYRVKSGATATYYGLFLELPSIKSYSVNSNILLNLKDLSNSHPTHIFGVNYAPTSGKLNVRGAISIFGAGWKSPIDTTSDKLDASLYLCGIFGANSSDITSSADINFVATGGTIKSTSDEDDIYSLNSTDVHTETYGIASLGGTVTNTGDISISTAGGTATSSGNVTSEAYASGISSREGTITNKGNISITTTGGKATSNADLYAETNASTYVSGISSTWDGTGVVFNAGDISIAATGGTAASSASTHFSSPFISAAANAYGSGLSSREGAITNAGNISITATGGMASSKVFTNEYAPAKAEAEAEASGISSYGGAITNTGNMLIAATGGTANASSLLTFIPYTSAPASASAEASGISSYGGDVVNNGSITVAAQAGTETNYGTTTSADAKAYAIHFSKGGTLRSTGLLKASAQFAPDVAPPSAGATPTAYQVFCDYGTLTIEQYALEVGHNQATFTAMYEGQIGTDTGANVVFNNTELTVHVAENFQNGVYDIPRLWKQETEEQKAAQINQFATAVAVTPDFNVSLIPSTDVDTPQKVALEYAPTESTPLKQALVQMNVEKQIHSIIRNNLTGQLLSGMLPASASTQQPSISAGIDGPTEYMVASLSNPSVLPAVTTKGENPHSVFFRPVYVNSYDSASSGYSSNTYGFVLGYDYRVYEEASDCLIGVHAGYTRGDIRYSGTNYGQRKEFVDTYYGGVHGISRFAESFILSGEASFFYADSEMRDDAPARLGKADYDSVAIRAEAAIGYLWDVTEGHTIVPEIGLSYSWQHRDSFTTRNKNSTDVTYGSLNNNELYANGRLKWFKQYTLSPTWIITPLIGAGITQILTDGEISNSMRLGNETQLVVDQDENTTFTPEANITVSCDEYYAMAGYSGGFGGTTKNNMFWLQMGVNF